MDLKSEVVYSYSFRLYKQYYILVIVHLKVLLKDRIVCLRRRCTVFVDRSCHDRSFFLSIGRPNFTSKETKDNVCCQILFRQVILKDIVTKQRIEEEGYTIGDRCKPMTRKLYTDHTGSLTLKLT